MIKITETLGMLTGIPQIDSEHIELIGLLNLINEYILTDKYRDQITTLIILFTTKLVRHCHTEEVLLVNSGCTSTVEHSLKHRDLVDKTITILENLNKHTCNDIAVLFEEMLREHIKIVDVPLFEEVRNELQKKKDKKVC